MEVPNADVGQEKADLFATEVAATLQAGTEVDMLLKTVGHKSLALRSLCGTQYSTNFSIYPLRTQQALQRAKETGISLRASKGGPWEELNADLGGALFVSNDTEALSLAKKMVVAFQGKESVKLHTWEDADAALAAMLEAISMTPLLDDQSRLNCTAQSTKQEGEEQRRIIVHVNKVPNSSLPERGTFIAYPPGMSASKKWVDQFRNSVKARVTEGQVIKMEARGVAATVNAIQTLASVRDITTRFQIRWVSAHSKNTPENEEDGRRPRALEIMAVGSDTWDQFNTIDFTRYTLLQPSSKISGLARAFASEISRKGGVTIHLPQDDHAGITNVAKAIASVRVEHGMSVESIASFGTGTRDHKEIRVTRFFIRPASKLVPQGRQAALSKLPNRKKTSSKKKEKRQEAGEKEQNKGEEKGEEKEKRDGEGKKSQEA